MTGAGGRFAAGATLLVLPFGAALLMWVTAGDVVAPELGKVVARAPGHSDSRAGVVEPAVNLDVPGYRFVPQSVDEGLLAVLNSSFVSTDGRAHQTAVVEDAAGELVGVSLSIDDDRRGTNHPDGATNLRALISGSTDLQLSETAYGSDTRIFSGHHSDDLIILWQRPTGFTLFVGRDEMAVRAFGRALKRVL